MIDQIIDIAYKAGELILDVYDRGVINFNNKDDHSPLTEADHLANDYITNALRKISDFPINAEESPIAYSERKNWKSFWLVDPLDGTKDFIAKNGEFTVNIALIKENKPILGVIYAPAIGELYYAIKEKGAYMLKNQVKVQLLIGDTKKYILAKSRFHDTQSVTDFINLNEIKETKRIGSALKFGKLASGDVTVYPRFNGSKEWDIAAGHIIVKEAGAKIIDLAINDEPQYNKKVIQNNYFIAYAPSISFDELKLPENIV